MQNMQNLNYIYYLKHCRECKIQYEGECQRQIQAQGKIQMSIGIVYCIFKIALLSWMVHI